MKLRLALAILVLTPVLAAPAAAEGPGDAEGRQLAQTYCGGCHSIAPAGGSPHPEAPPLRDLHLRYDVEDLSEALVEGLVSGHPDMPSFQFEPLQAEAIVRYLKSLE